MEKGLIPFEQRFSLEIIWLDGEPLFNAQDVGRGLCMSEVTVRRALQRMKPSYKRLITNDMISAVHTMNGRRFNNAGENFVIEPGLYELVFKSRKPEAENFRCWVFEEVLPSLRKTGQYSLMPVQPPALPRDFEEALEHLLVAVRGKRLAEEQLALQAPKVRFAEAIQRSSDLIDFETLAKILGFPGIGRNKLFAILRQERVLRSDPEHHNLPYQEYLDRHWFKVEESVFVDRFNETHVSYQTLVTARGQEGIHGLLETVLGPDPRGGNLLPAPFEGTRGGGE